MPQTSLWSPRRIPCILTFFLIAAVGLASPEEPVSTPTRLTCPPNRTDRKDLAKVPTPPTSTTRSTPAPSVSSSHSVFPIRCCFVIYSNACPNLHQSLQLSVAARCRNDSRACGFSQLDSENRYAPAPQCQNGLTASDRAAGERIPGGDPGAGKSRRLLVGKIGRAPLPDPSSWKATYSARTPSIAPPSAEFALVSSSLPRLPFLKKNPGYSISRLPTGNAFTDRDHFARPIGKRNQGKGLGRVFPFDYEAIAKIEGSRFHFHQHLAGSGLGNITVQYL